MSIAMQLGDIATRIRRFTRATGNLQIDLSANAQPTVQLADISRAPYAAEPKSLTTRYSTGSDGVHAPYAALQAAPGTAVVIDTLWLEGFATANQMLIAIGRNKAFPVPGTGQTVFDVSSPNNNFQSNGIQVCVALAVSASTLAPIPNTFQFGQVVSPTPAGGLSTVVNFVEPIVLFGASPTVSPFTNPAIGDCFVVAGTSLTQGIAFSLWGREYTLLQGLST